MDSLCIIFCFAIVVQQLLWMRVFVLLIHRLW